ncbi:tRNA-splicing endonuclease subunit Sen2 [Adelges cooleyi]|uniref:tRNA-splicing endonuclease subunit Sen2 n=1 Tax=Adelges cooleyi TaxID=133065 RepID=UPI00217F5249|nr:tRNA-splicing endonuclease subunit Sen2 [Adelges cooleyi]
MLPLKPPVLKKELDTSFIPFPICDENGEISKESWPTFHGVLDKQTVIINDSNEIVRLTNFGCFGQSNLPHRVTSFTYTNSKNKTTKRKRNWGSLQLLPYNFTEKPNDNVNEPNEEEDNPINWNDLKQNFPDKYESLKLLAGQNQDIVYHLLLEEAFFLHFTLECLEIKNEDGMFINTTQCWNIFNSLKTNFPYYYAAYHYYRSRGWVVKPGSQYGGDFVLYKISPVYYHSSYVVIITINDQNTKITSWPEMLGCVRVTEAASKDLILCTVFGPPYNDSSPIDMTKYTVTDTIIKRWVPAQNR